MEFKVNRSFEAVRALTQMLWHVKGKAGTVVLKAHHSHAGGQTRNIITSKNIVVTKHKPSGSPTGSGFAPTAEPVWNDGPDGVLVIGEVVEFKICSSTSGYVHLFDIGTSGTVLKLGPSKEYPNNRIEAGVEITVPSPKICLLPHGQFWQVAGPTTAETGEPERLLVLVTQDDVELQIEDLHPGLVGRDLYTRSVKARPSFSAVPRVQAPTLFQAPQEWFEYGLVEMAVAEG